MAIAMLGPAVFLITVAAAIMVGSKPLSILVLAVFAVAPLLFFLRQRRRADALVGSPSDEAVQTGIRALTRPLRWALVFPVPESLKAGVVANADDLVVLRRVAAYLRINSLGPAALLSITVIALVLSDVRRKGFEGALSLLFWWSLFGPVIADRVGFAGYVKNVLSAAEARFHAAAHVDG